MIWTTARQDLLRAKWGKMLTSDIAELLGCTRNAVIGKAHRMRLPRLASALVAQSAESRAKMSAAQRKRWANISRENLIEMRMAFSRGQKERYMRKAKFGR